MSKIKLSPEEYTKWLSYKTSKGRDNYLQKCRDRRRQLMLKTVVLSAVLLESFDELQKYGLMRFKLKQLSNNFIKELDKYIDQVYDRNEDPMGSTQYIVDVSRELDKILK